MVQTSGSPSGTETFVGAKNCRQRLHLYALEDGIPLTIEKLIEFPGVGRKTANVFLAEAHGGRNIGVDTHVTRLSKKLGWTENKTPEKIEKIDDFLEITTNKLQ